MSETTSPCDVGAFLLNSKANANNYSPYLLVFAVHMTAICFQEISKVPY